MCATDARQRTSTWAGSTPHTQLQLQFFSPPTTTLFSSYPVPHPWEGDGGAGAPVLLEHRVSPGARLLTLVGHYGVTSERSELFAVYHLHLPDDVGGGTLSSSTPVCRQFVRLQTRRSERPKGSKESVCHRAVPVRGGATGATPECLPPCHEHSEIAPVTIAVFAT